MKLCSRVTSWNSHVKFVVLVKPVKKLYSHFVQIIRNFNLRFFTCWNLINEKRRNLLIVQCTHYQCHRFYFLLFAPLDFKTGQLFQQMFLLKPTTHSFLVGYIMQKVFYSLIFANSHSRNSWSNLEIVAIENTPDSTSSQQPMPCAMNHTRMS